ncbi:hypothetical protein, partial [Bartonella sp. CL29QHWL]|uniref:hypothetical protein n=1 Tax=Bartonella sp. CL29QHWL TaxID=3243522 RepID=UPI0035CF7B22
VPRFYDFANSQKTSKLPINRPIKAYTSLLQTYHQPIHCHQPFSPNALHSPRDQRKMRKTIDALLPSREAMA